MKRFMNKKVATIGLAAGLALGAAGAAFAYYTATGQGNGTATAGAQKNVSLSVTDVTLNGPGAAAVSVPYSFTNTAGNGDETFGTVSISNITGYTTGCTSTLADLQVVTSASPIGLVTDGSPFTSSSATEPTIAMGSNGSDQSACEGVQFTVTLSAAQGS